MELKHRVAKLESSAGAKSPPEPVYSEEDLALMRQIVERTYADPVRYADRIALFERFAQTSDSGGG